MIQARDDRAATPDVAGGNAPEVAESLPSALRIAVAARSVVATAARRPVLRSPATALDALAA
jgi:hypothetical protein